MTEPEGNRRPAPLGRVALFAAGILLALAGAFTALVVQSQSSLAQTDESVLAGFKLTDVSGKPTSLPLGESPFLLNFWGTWCPPCRHELPLLDEVHASGEHTVIAVAIDKPEDVARYVADNPLAMSVAIAGFEGIGMTQAAGNATAAMPYSVFIDATGTITATKVGPFADVAEIYEFIAP